MSALGLSFPSSVPTSPPIRGYGDPNVNGRAGIIGQEYTDLKTGQVYMKGNPDLRELRWFPIGTSTGNATVIYGTAGQISPLGITAQAGPAIWYGTNGAIWVKTDPGNDFLHWYPLTTVPLPSFINGDPVVPHLVVGGTDYGGDAYYLHVSSLPNSQGQKLTWTFPAKWVDGSTLVPGGAPNGGTTHWPVFSLTIQRSAFSTNTPDQFPFHLITGTSPNPPPTTPDWVNIAQWTSTSVDALLALLRNPDNSNEAYYIDPTTPNPNLNYRIIMNLGPFGIGPGGSAELDWNVVSVNGVQPGTATLIQQIKNLSSLIVTAKAVATDSSGNIYVTGLWQQLASFDGGATSRQAHIGSGSPFLVKYLPDGRFSWIREFYVPGGNILPSSLCVGSDGNVTVGGGFNGTSGSVPATLTELVVGGVSLPCDTLSITYAFAIQYTSGGSLVWAKSYGVLATNPTAFNALVDNGTFTYAVLGFTTAADPGTGLAGPQYYNFQVLKIARNGSITVLVNGGAHAVTGFERVFVNSIQQDASGNLLLSGVLGDVTDMDGFTTASGGMFMAKYSSTVPHTLIWSPTKVKVVQGPSILGAAIEPSGEIIVCGSFTGSYDIGGGSGNKINSGASASNLDSAPFIAGYASDGSWNWQLVFTADTAGGDTSINYASSVVVIGGQIYVVGRTGGAGIFIGTDFINYGKMFLLNLTSHGSTSPTLKWYQLANASGGGAFISPASSVGLAVGANPTGPVVFGILGISCTFVQPVPPNITLTTSGQDGFIVRYLP